jgi:hypothetical protein
VMVPRMITAAAPMRSVCGDIFIASIRVGARVPPVKLAIGI